MSARFTAILTPIAPATFYDIVTVVVLQASFAEADGVTFTASRFAQPRRDLIWVHDYALERVNVID